MQKTTTYREQSRIFLTQAYEELAKGDLPQDPKRVGAPRRKWSTAVAEERGWEHRHDRDLYSIVSRLRLETRNPELTGLFGAAASLRLNASQSWLATQDVEDHLRQVDQFVSRLEKPLPDSPEKVTKKQPAPPSREQSRLLLDQARLELSKGYLFGSV